MEACDLVILLIQTYTQGRDTLLRHWDYFKNSGATEIQIITTEDDTQSYPEYHVVHLGKNCYIDGSHLPTRLVETLEYGLSSIHDHILIAEYDVLFLCPIRYKGMEHAVASHRAGSKTWGSLASAYYHNPYLFKREFTKRFIDEGKKVISEGICHRNPGQASTPESSPDVFFGLVAERLNQTVQIDLWSQFSRNSFDIPGDLELAREARRNGIGVIHGTKSAAEFEFIFS